MTNNPHAIAKRRKGLFLLLLPPVVAPILFLLVSNTTPVLADSPEMGIGMNTEMPAPILKEHQESKAEAYLSEKETKESEKPWALPDFLVEDRETESEDGITQTAGNVWEYSSASLDYSPPSPGIVSRSAPASNPEAELMRQLQELETLLQDGKKGVPAGSGAGIDLSSKDADPELRQLEELMGKMKDGPSQPDPELVQLERLMDKLLELQNPGRSGEELILPEGLSPVPMADQGISVQESPAELDSNGFFGLEPNSKASVSNEAAVRFPKTIGASVSRTQEIFPGEAVELRLDQELALKSGTIPAGAVLYAVSSLSGARMQLNVTGILWENTLIPVALKAYSLDGIPGIELADVKGAAQWLKDSGKAAKGFNINSYGTDWQSQLATSSVEATRTLLRGKSKLKKLSIKAGHPLLLVDSSNSSTSTTSNL